jgi:eukaryotic-like serine/threonine-protein kinase
MSYLCISIAGRAAGGLVPSVLVGRDGADGQRACHIEGPALMRVPGYDLLEEVARGGMGIVYRARQHDPEREVALKMLLPHQAGSAELAARFRLEARTLADLEHPAILPVYQSGEHDGMPFFTMKLATGGTLAQRKQGLVGNWRAIATLMATIAEAVQFAHEHGVLHRDLKPGNILFDERERVYVSDFGLAKLVTANSGLTRSVEFLGTPHYVAPEVAASSARGATTASDVYSLGAVLYELIAGRPPFEAEGVPALLRKIENETASFQAACSAPRDLAVICLKCLAKEPSRRYASARDMADDLHRWIGGRNILARPATPAERFTSWVRRNPALATTLGVLVAVMLGALVLQAVAYRRTQNALADALLAEAKAVRQSGRAGQRLKALSTVERAAKIRRDVAARNEMASALLHLDVRPLQNLPAYFANAGSTFDFLPDFTRYVMGRQKASRCLARMVVGAAPSSRATIRRQASFVSVRTENGCSSFASMDTRSSGL